MVRLRLIRHATLLVEIAGQTVLVDPMLDDKEAQEPVPGTFNPRRYPLVPLPEDAHSIVGRADAALITHRHVDHFDGTAIAAIRGRSMAVFCQPPDERPLRDLGFADVRPVRSSLEWRGITLTRTDGRHGTGELAELMAPVSGFVIRAEGQAIYIAGDTVWCDEVRTALSEQMPDVVVVNAGEARMLEGDPITMSADDVITVARHSSGRVVAVHMEALNHCVLTRAELAEAVASCDLAVEIPHDGETLVFDGPRLHDVSAQDPLS